MDGTKTHLNRSGLKDSIDRWRTINGVRWGTLGVGGPEAAEFIRSHGVRCRTFDDDLFVHPDDLTVAIEVLDRWESMVNEKRRQ